MSDKSPSIPMPDWWYAAVDRAMESWQPDPKVPPRKLKQVELGRLADSNESTVSKVLKRKTAPLLLIVKISEVLRVPRPVFLPQTEQEALALHGALALRKADAEIERVRGGIHGPHDAPDDDGGEGRTSRTVRRSR